MHPASTRWSGSSPNPNLDFLVSAWDSRETYIYSEDKQGESIECIVWMILIVYNSGDGGSRPAQLGSSSHAVPTSPQSLCLSRPVQSYVEGKFKEPAGRRTPDCDLLPTPRGPLTYRRWSSI